MPKKGERDLVKERSWRGIIRDWQEGGLSTADYCRRENLNYHSFADWRREIEKRDVESQRQSAVLRRQRRRSKSKTMPKAKNVLLKNSPDDQPNIESIPDFAPVRLVDNARPTERSDTRPVLEVVLATGIVLRVSSNCPLQFLQSVVSLLEVR